jgi:flagellar motor switch protein FliN/FliY
MSMGETKPGATVEWLLEVWTGRLAETLETMTGERPQASWRPTANPAGEGVLWWEQPLSLAADAVVWAGAPEPAWMEIGASTLRGAGLEASSAEEAKKTYFEILSQALSGIALSLGDRLGASISCENGREIASPPARLNAFEIELTLGEMKLPGLQFRFGPALIQILDAANSRVQEEAGSAKALSRGAGAGAGMDAAGAANPRTLDLLLDVELPVSVSFGRAELALKDVLKLTTGSIVELSRSISEPVEVIVNNCVIARGEVVVVDGNYGVKIQEIVSRDRRLKTVR